VDLVLPCSDVVAPYIVLVTCREAKAAGTSFLVGFETEFVLLGVTDPATPVNKYGLSVSSALLAGSVEATVLDEIADALRLSGVELQMYHSEGAEGQARAVIYVPKLV
jgi:glutamine synthetase